MRVSLGERLSAMHKIPLLQNLSWLMVAEVLSRLSRIVTLFVLAAYFTNEQYGAAMLALLIHELFRVFTRIGAGAKIIQCADKELVSILGNASTLQWCVALLVAVAQIMMASMIARFYDMPQLESLIELMALSHLFYPMVATRIFEQHRENQMRYYGVASGACIAFENLFTALLAFGGLGIFSVAIAKLSASIFWVCLFYRLPTQVTSLALNLKEQRDLIRFSFATLTSELSRMLRFQSDSLIAARLLTPDQFGLYSFAKSAGLGIAQAFSQAYLSSLYPYMCKQLRSEELKQSNTARNLTVAICLLFLTQSLLANVYVVWLFPDRWADAAGFASLLCLVAIPMLVVDHYALQFRARNRAWMETKIIALSALWLSIAMLVMKPSSVEHIVNITVLTSFVWLALIPMTSRTVRLKLHLQFRRLSFSRGV